MSEQVLRDNRGNRMGAIRTQSDGKMIGNDAVGRRVGEYDPKHDVTRDSRGSRVGTGNQLALLIGNAKH